MASITPARLELSTSPQTWTNMPAAQTEFLGATWARTITNLQYFDKVRLVGRVTTAGAAGAVLAVQYDTTDAFSAPAVLGNTLPINATGTVVTAWADIPAGAKTGDVYLRLGGQGGNGVADPVFGVVALEFYGTPSMERAGLIAQVIANSYGLANNMQDNAAGYKAVAAAAVATPAQLAAVMVADANEYKRRIGWMTTLFTNNQALATAALGDANFTLAQATALRDTLLAAANHTLAADLSSYAAITTEANWIQANVPNYSRFW